MSLDANPPATFNVARYFVDRNLDEGRGDAVAVLYRNEKLTYAEVAGQVDRAANAFIQAGVRRLERVLLLLLDSPDFVAAFWGAIKMGAVAVPASTQLAPDDYALILRDCGARCLVAEAALLEKVAPAIGRISTLETVLVAGNTPSGYMSFEEALAKQSPQAPAAATRREDPAFWLYTSGSTGRPKAAIHRHLDMVCCFENYARQVLEISRRDITFSASKLFFAYGLGNGLYFPFGAGATTVLVPERPTADKIFETLRRYRPTVFYAVPSLYAAMLQVDGKDASNLSSVRCAVSAGEALPAPVWTRFKGKFGVPILDGIGSTEMLHMFISNRLNDIVPGSSGRPVPGYEARIVDERGNDLPAGQVGELWVRGESAAAGYWDRPEATSATFRGEWTVTGDKYIRDERGYFWYCGRSDDMMKVSGLWVSPLEVESALLLHPAVLECAVVGARDEDGLTKPKAFVVLKGASSASTEIEAELMKSVRDRLPSHKVPRWIVPAEALPKTATGKIQRYKLREEMRGKVL